MQRLDEAAVPILMGEQGLKDLYHKLRCEALKGLGRKEEAERECTEAERLSKKLYEGVSPERMAQLTGKKQPGACAHSKSLQDDCRQSNGLIPPPGQGANSATCEIHPHDPNQLCYANYLWNLGELVQSEANGETYGSRTAVAWTVRNRVNKQFANSGTFPGSSGDCAFNCAFPNDPVFCAWQKRYCCNVHSGQFFLEHLPAVAPSNQNQLTFETLRLVFGVVAGLVVNPQTAWLPPNTIGSGDAGCPLYNYSGGFTSVDACTKQQLACLPRVDTATSGTEYRNLLDWDPFGPYYFYATCVVSGGVTNCFQCRGFQSGDFIDDISHEIAVVGYPGPTCTNNPPFSDNCYGRLSRVREFFAGNINDFQGRSAPVQWSPSTPDRVTLPGGQGSNSFIYRSDVPNGGGKEVRIEMKVEEGSGSALVQVYLQKFDGTVVYYFGGISTNNNNWNTKTYTSSVPVHWEGSVLSIFNTGTRAVSIRKVKFID
ncbi:MAG: hypothetical protein ACRERD_06525 [Candidatus Binatia bacterium]